MNSRQGEVGWRRPGRAWACPMWGGGLPTFSGIEEHWHMVTAMKSHCSSQAKQGKRPLGEMFCHPSDFYKWQTFNWIFSLVQDSSAESAISPQTPPSCSDSSSSKGLFHWPTKPHPTFLLLEKGAILLLYMGWA
jgi:hypothetical protein